MGLLGKVIRNSDFTNVDQKMLAAKRYLAENAKLFLYIHNSVSGVVERITDDLARKWKERGADVTSLNPEILSYIIDLAFFFGIQSIMCSQFAGDSLLGVYEKILAEAKITNIERLLLVMIMVELGGLHWKRHFNSLVSVNKNNRIVLDMIIDKIWEILHSRVTNETERENIALAAYAIERHMGTDKSAKSAIIQKVKLVANQTSQREGS